MGGSTSTTTVDKTFNAGLLALYQESADLAEEYDNLYKYGTLTGEDDPDTISEMEYDIASIQAQYGLLDQETAAAASDLETQIALNEASVEQAEAETAYQTESLSKKQALLGEYYDEVSNIDEEEYADKASADVEQAYKNSLTSAKQQAAMTGVNPSGSAFTSGLTNTALEKTKATAAAKESARQTASDEKFSRMTSAFAI